VVPFGGCFPGPCCATIASECSPRTLAHRDIVRGLWNVPYNPDCITLHWSLDGTGTGGLPRDGRLLAAVGLRCGGGAGMVRAGEIGHRIDVAGCAASRASVLAQSCFQPSTRKELGYGLECRRCCRRNRGVVFSPFVPPIPTSINWRPAVVAGARFARRCGTYTVPPAL